MNSGLLHLCMHPCRYARHPRCAATLAAELAFFHMNCNTNLTAYWLLSQHEHAWWHMVPMLPPKGHSVVDHY
jgi:hypothetical protein